jgi:acyl carrier protein
VDPDQLREMRLRNSLFRMEWVAVEGGEATGTAIVVGDVPWDGAVRRCESLEEGSSALAEEVPEAVLVDLRLLVGDLGADVPERIESATGGGVSLLCEWLGEERLAEVVFAVVDGAGSGEGGGEGMDLAATSVFRLLRSVQAEHGSRLRLIASDREPRSNAALECTLLDPSAEREVALRRGRILVPRLRPGLENSGGQSPPGALERGGGAVLVKPGAILSPDRLDPSIAAAEVVFAAEDAAQAELLHERLGAAGLAPRCRVEVCDLADADALVGLLGSFSEARPLGAVYYDGTSVSSPSRWHRPEMGIGDLRAMREVLHLHEAAVDPRLPEFVLCSSSGPWPPLPAADAVSGFFEALVAIRRAAGLAGTTVRIDERMFDLGWLALERVRGTGDAYLAAPVAGAKLTGSSGGVGLHPMYEGLLARDDRPSRDRRAMLRTRLGSVGRNLRGEVVADVIREEAAAVLLEKDPSRLVADKTFLDLGFDSLDAVEFRNRVADATGVEISKTVVFEYPTIEGIAAFVEQRLEGGSTAPLPIERAMDHLEETLSELDAGLTDGAGVQSRLRGLGRRIQVALDDPGEEESTEELGSSLETVGDEQLFAIIDREFGSV